MNSESSEAGQSEESRDFPDKNDPNSWAGKDPEDIEDAIPDDWIKSPAKKGGTKQAQSRLRGPAGSLARNAMLS